MTLEINYRRTFTRDRDVEPDESIFVRVSLKSLGQLQSEIY
jgi:hypothetical protein